MTDTMMTEAAAAIERVERLEAEIERLQRELDNCAQARGDWKKFCEAENQAEIEQLRAECDRVKELFALKWDATQSEETTVLEAEVQRLRADVIKTHETLGNERHLMNAEIDRLRRGRSLFIPQLTGEATTPEMHKRVRELATPPRDDFDRVVLLVLDEIERLRTMIEDDVLIYKKLMDENERLREIASQGIAIERELRTEVERLRAALQQAVDDFGDTPRKIP